MTDISKTEVALEKFSQKELGDVKVLMVEDDLFFSDMILTGLSQKGCIPYTTADGSKAIGLAEQYLPDVIILDLMLPELSGEEILKQLKSRDDLKDIPVIVFSNKSESDGIKAVMEAGAAKYLVKSATEFSTLIDVVKTLIKTP